MKDTQRGFIPLIAAIVLGLAAIGGSVAVMAAYQNVGRSGTTITNSSVAQTTAAAASDAATTSEVVTKETVVTLNTAITSCDRMVFGKVVHFGMFTSKECYATWQAAVEAKQNEAPVAYVPPAQVGGSGGSGSIHVELTEERSQPAVPGPTTAQIAGALLLCADARMAHICTQTFWDGYMTNVVFRSEVDGLVIQFQHQNEQARLAAQLKQQKNCAAWMGAISPLLAGMSPEASINAQKSSMATCSGKEYDDTAYKLEEIQEDVDELKKIACPLGSSDINCQLMQ